MQDIIYKYSDFFLDDGGMSKVVSDFTKLGEELIAESKRVKTEINANLKIDSTADLIKYEQAVENIRKVNENYKKTVSDLIISEQEFNKQKKDNISVLQQEEKLKQEQINTLKKELNAEIELNKALQSETNLKKSQVQLEAAQRREREAAEKSIKREKDAYGQLSVELNQLFRASANVAAEMFLLEEQGLKTSPAYARLSSEFDMLKGKTQKVDSALKQIDSTLGRNQRNVGNYASGFNGLQNSINQMTRELPAFTFSAQTGFLALSNNFPTFTDEIKRLQDANKVLAEQGKPVESIFKQITSALFSFNTAISLGITLVTVYGKEIAQMVGSLFGLNSTLNEVEKSYIDVYNAQEKYILATADGAKQTRKDYDEFTILTKGMADNTKSMAERLDMADRLKEKYAGYLDNFSKEQILAVMNGKENKKLSATIQQLTKDVNERNIAVAQSNEANKLFSDIADIKEEIKLRESLNKLMNQEDYGQREFYKARTKERVKISNDDENFIKKYGEIVVNDFGQYDTQQIQRMKIMLNNLVDEYNRERFKVNKKIIKTSLLDYRPEKDKEKKEKKEKTLREQQINNADYLASDFEFRKALMENAIKTNEDIFNSDKYTVDVRIEAQQQMVTQMLALARMEKDEALRVLEEKYNKTRSETVKNSKGEVSGMKYTKQGLLELEVQYGIDKNTIQVNNLEKEREILKKGEKIALLETLKMQIDNLKYLQKHLSQKSDLYQEYERRISEIQAKIDRITMNPKLLEMNDKLFINEGELNRLIKLNEKLNSLDNKPKGVFGIFQRKKMLKEIEEFEKERDRIEKNAALQRKQDRISSIDEEQKSFVKDTKEWKTLELEKQQILIDIEKDAINERLKTQQTFWEKLSINIEDIIGKIIDRLIELNQKRVESNQKAVEDQNKTLDIQEARAQQGMQNTLGFEQRKLAEREADLLKSQKKQERLEKIKALWTSYTSYSDKEKDPNTAIMKALRDFAILEAITASFGEGGAVEDVLDKIPTNGKGIIRGRSHRGRNGGIPVLVEGKEGIFSKREMSNLGKDNFYRIKDMAGMGPVDTNFFSGQRQLIAPRFVPVAQNNDQIINGLEEVKKAIEQKPVESWDMIGVTETFVEIVQTVSNKNKKTRNFFKVNKPRL